MMLYKYLVNKEKGSTTSKQYIWGPFLSLLAYNH